MKALTISQPFAELIARGEKWVENRTWGTGYRGPLAIHAGKGTQYLTTHQLRRYDRGCIVAVCELVACVLLDGLRRGDGRQVQAYEVARMEAAGVRIECVIAHAHTEGPWCWILRDVRRIAKVAYRGQTGLFDVPDELIQRALAEAAGGRSTGASSLLREG